MLRNLRGLIGNYFRTKKLYKSEVVEGLKLECYPVEP